MIKKSMKLVGLLGWPIEESLSPDMHNAAFEALDLNWRYYPFPISPDRFEKEIKKYLALDFQGFNVTIPYKRAVLAYLNSIDTTVKKVGAVNTITIKKEQESESISRGYNTDVLGFINALKEGNFEKRSWKKAVVVGAGGAARAVVFGLFREGFSDITILNRSLQTAQQIQEDFREFSAKLEILPLTEKNIINHTAEADLLVNTTPIGAQAMSDQSIWPDHIPLPSRITIFDVVYNPPMTKLLRQGKAARASIISGIEMLVHQGALSFQLWTKIQAPLDVMRQACYKKFGGSYV